MDCAASMNDTTPKRGLVWPTNPLLALIGLVVLVMLAYVVAFNILVNLERSRTATKVAAYQNIIEDELNRLRHLPKFLSKDIGVAAVLQGQEPADLNERFKELSQSARAEAIYLMKPDGLTVAASNADQTPTFLGENYGFRPYFINSMQGKDAGFFAIGATTSRPGYFLASPVFGNGQVDGVLALKLDLTALTETLEESNDLILVNNPDKIVVLSSKPDWRYRSLSDLDTGLMAKIKGERQFGAQTLGRLNWVERPSARVRLEGQDFLLDQRLLASPEWTVSYLEDLAPIRLRSILIGAATAGVFALIAALGLFLRSRRLSSALIASQQDRARLTQEIEVRRKAETDLQAAQVELNRTSKLAALGQLSASVTHELGQPITAMKNYLAAERFGVSAENPLVRNLSGIVDRMEKITQQLRFFSVAKETEFDPVPVATLLQGAVQMIQHDLVRHNIQLILPDPMPDQSVIGDRLRLEQVVINLLRNAIAAMEDMPERVLTISGEAMHGKYAIRIQDTGHGLGQQSLNKMIEPFHTTRASGEGMGLGLSISNSILQEHNGSLNATETPDGGACFTLSVPITGAPDANAG